MIEYECQSVLMPGEQSLRFKDYIFKNKQDKYTGMSLRSLASYEAAHVDCDHDGAEETIQPTMAHSSSIWDGVSLSPDNQVTIVANYIVNLGRGYFPFWLNGQFQSFWPGKYCN